MEHSRYAYLDGIRGIAAILVLTRHTEAFWNFSFYRSYLAVDLFFILSGFVIANAYDKKLNSNEISIKKFVFTRIIRIYPVYFLSTIICSLILLKITLSGSTTNYSSISNTLFIIAFSFFIIPSIAQNSTALFPINGPYWSLFYELIANFLYATIRKKLNTKILVIGIVLFLVSLCIGAAINRNLNIGFTWGTVSIVLGFSRAMFGILLGLLLHRHINFLSNFVQNKTLPVISILSILIVLTSQSAGQYDPIIDIFTVTAIFPLCIIMASQEASKKTKNISLTLGSASYPIYVLHEPTGEFFSYLMKNLIVKYAPYSGILLVCFLIAISLLVEKYYDIPIRKWAHKKIFK